MNLWMLILGSLNKINEKNNWILIDQKVLKLLMKYIQKLIIYLR